MGSVYHEGGVYASHLKKKRQKGSGKSIERTKPVLKLARSFFQGKGGERKEKL